jgi:hypothetical protein
MMFICALIARADSTDVAVTFSGRSAKATAVP